MSISVATPQQKIAPLDPDGFFNGPWWLWVINLSAAIAALSAEIDAITPPTPGPGGGVTTQAVSVTGTTTINPSIPPADDSLLVVIVTQDATGHAATFATGAGKFKFPPAIQNGANLQSIVTFAGSTVDNVWYLCAASILDRHI